MAPSNRNINFQIKIIAASWLACLFGVAFAAVFCIGRTFDWAGSVLGLGISRWVLFATAVIVALIVFRIGIFWWMSPFRKWLKQIPSENASELPASKVNRIAFRVPLVFAAYVWVLWLLVAVSLAWLGSTNTLEFLVLAAGVGLVAGFSSAALEYFLVEAITRKTLPEVYRAEELNQSSAMRLRLWARLLLLFILAIIPLMLVALLEPRREVILVLGSSGILLALVLAWLANRSVTQPLKEFTPPLTAVQNGNMGDNLMVPVSSNDEIGDLAINFNRMVSSVQLKNREVETIYHISQEITDSLELDATLQAILEEVRNIIPYDGAEICLYDKTDDLLHVRAWGSSATVIMDTRGRTYKLGSGYTGWVGAERKSLLIPDVDAHEGQKPTIRQIADGVFLNGYLGVPLVVKGNKMVGTLELVSTKRSVFDEHTQQILEIIAPQAAIAIDNAEQVLERERELRAQIARLKIEIDDAKRAKQVADITETAYFRDLKEQVKKLREASNEEGGAG